MIAWGIARRRAAGALAAWAAAAAGSAAACAPEGPKPMRAWSPSYEFRVTVDPAPPYANEPTLYRVTVLDRETRQPIEGGEGQIFATSEDRVNRWDSFEPAPEVGTYTARVSYLTAGDWKVGMRFRRDSTAALERVEDWVQAVRSARPLSERPIK